MASWPISRIVCIEQASQFTQRKRIQGSRLRHELSLAVLAPTLTARTASRQRVYWKRLAEACKLTSSLAGIEMTPLPSQRMHFSARDVLGSRMVP